MGEQCSKHEKHAPLWGGVVATLMVLIGVAGPAAAQESQPAGVPSTVAALVDGTALEQAVEEFVAGDQVSVAELASVVAPEVGVNIELSESVSVTDGELVFTSDEGIGESEDDLSIGISYAGVQLSPEIVDGVAVSAQVEQGLDIVMRATGDGAQMLAVLADENASTELAFDLNLPEGATLIENSDGSIAVTTPVASEFGTISQEVALIEAPWAVDAAGSALETSYDLVDGALVQTVVTDENTVFPVVADPKITRAWWNTTVYFNRKETNNLAFGTGAAAAIAAAIPDPTISKIVAGLMGVSTAYLAWIYNQNKCVKMVSYGHVTSAVWQPYSGKEAGGYCK